MELINMPGFKAAPKPFSFSYSKIKNYETCPKRHYHCDIINDPEATDPDKEPYELSEGKKVHDALAKAIEKGIPLPAKYAHYQQWVTYALSCPGKIEVEKQYAIDDTFQPTDWFAKDTPKTKRAWHRSIADVVGIHGPVAVALDWKTGKPLDDGVQLSLVAACIMAHHPGVMAVRTEFVWLAHGAVSRVNVHRRDLPGMWAGVLPRVYLYENALKTNTFPPKPGYLCRRYCSVKSCPHNGEEN